MTTKLPFNSPDGFSGTSLNVTGNATVGNLITSGTANVGNLITSGTANVTGNANVGNLGTARIIATGNISGTQFISNIATGNAPFVVTSNTPVANLNVANAQNSITSVGNLTSLTVTGNITGNTNGFAVGYIAIPQNIQPNSYGLTALDTGRHIFRAVGAPASTYTIPANSNVAFNIGSAVTFVNMSANSATISITTDTLTLAGNGATGNRTLTANGIATCMKITGTQWLISGTNLT